jgi:hypothetical protein
MLIRKSRPFILRYIRENWHLKTAQADNYIRMARKEWRRYFEKLQGDGMGYHMAQLRDLKDQALQQKEPRLVLDIVKEEAKILGLYPAEKYDVEYKIPDVVEVVHYVQAGKPPEIIEIEEEDVNKDYNKTE